ncbi:MAG: sulfotransferase [Methylacidiphilaceae bacterium]|nr:sulfotransferase [Candidatus Methylacidiphilaceae bacterium]
MKSRAILVLGMHRCGTSAITRCLGFLGAELGSDFLAPAGDNPTGFWEDKRFLAINRRLTEALGEEADRWWEHCAPLEIPLSSSAVRSLVSEAAREIQRRFASSGWWAFKDPRTLRAFPFWQEALSQAEAQIEQVVAVRHPLACAQSLVQRDQGPEDRSLLLWTSQYLGHWPRVAARPFVAVDYDRLLEEPERELRRLSDRLGLPWRPEAVAEARSFLRPDLRHARLEPKDLQNRFDIPPLVVETFEALKDLCIDREAKAASARMLALHAEFRRLVPLLRTLDSQTMLAERLEREGFWQEQMAEWRRGESALKAKLEEARAILAVRERELSALQKQMVQMEASRTWRFSQRVRGLERSLRRLRKRLLGSRSDVSG